MRFRRILTRTLLVIALLPVLYLAGYAYARFSGKFILWGYHLKFGTWKYSRIPSKAWAFHVDERSIFRFYKPLAELDVAFCKRYRLKPRYHYDNDEIIVRFVMSRKEMKQRLRKSPIKLAGLTPLFTVLEIRVAGDVSTSITIYNVEHFDENVARGLIRRAMLRQPEEPDTIEWTKLSHALTIEEFHFPAGCDTLYDNTDGNNSGRFILSPGRKFACLIDALND